MWGRMIVMNKIGKLRDQGIDPAVAAALEGLLYACLDALRAPAWLNGHSKVYGRGLAHTLRRYAAILDASVAEDATEKADLERDYVINTLRFLRAYNRMAYKKAVAVAHNSDAKAYGLTLVELARAGFVGQGDGIMPDRIRELILEHHKEFDTAPMTVSGRSRLGAWTSGRR